MIAVKSLMLLISIFNPVAESVLCYECVSLNQYWCTEHFKSDITGHWDRLINCTTNCMKMIAHVDGDRQFYVRTCDLSHGTPGKCSTASQILGIPISTICVCSSDACNAGTSLKINFISIMCIFIFSLGLWSTVNYL